jgi:hypothetical protein
MDENQGCNFHGFFKVYRVPGNFYIATHEYEDIVMALKMEGYVFDFSYRIHHLSFGNADDFNYIAKKFPDVLLEHPADGLEG